MSVEKYATTIRGRGGKGEQGGMVPPAQNFNVTGI